MFLRTITQERNRKVFSSIIPQSSKVAIEKKSHGRIREISFTKLDGLTPNETVEIDGIRGETEHAETPHKKVSVVMAREWQNQVQTLTI